MAMNYKDKITMKFNISQLDRIIITLLNNAFNKKFANNVLRLFELFNPAIYKTEYEKEVRVYLIKEISHIIIDNNILDKDGILTYLNTDGKYYNDCVELLNNLFEEEITDDEVALLDRTISDQLRYSTLISHADMLQDMIVNIKTDNYESLDDAIKEIGSEIETVNREIKLSRESIEDAKSDLSLSSSNFVNYVGKLIENERNPKCLVPTGIRTLNDILDGGWHPGRLYIALSVAKGGKSIFLLNAASWAKRYGKYKTHNPNLKPCIVYLSMENSNEETIGRLWNHCFGDNSRMRDYDKVDVARMFEQAGLFTPNNPNDPELLIWYRSNRSINTSDLNAMLEDLKKEGKECVFLVLDYLRRIRPTETNKDLRLELSNVTNELKTIATEQDIPILTASQLNRAAFAELEAAENLEGSSKAFDRIGSSNIGESIDIIQNCDMAFTLVRNSSNIANADGSVDRFLFFKVVATRMRENNVSKFKHRFKDNNAMCLIEDINMAHSVSIITEDDFAKSQSTGFGKTSGRRIIISDGNKK